VTPLLLALLAQAPTPADAPTPAAALVSRTTAQERVEQLLEDGRHVRFGTDGKGPVHVWWPRSYQPATAVTVVYVHGYFTDVDQAWVQHALVTQFRDAGKNALFVVPQSPSSWKDELFHPDLGALLELVKAQAKVELPRGAVTVVGHSGAYRTVARWLGESAVDRVVLIDGLYAADKELEQWSQEKNHRLLLVGFETTQRTEWLLKRVRGAVRLDDAPWMYDAPPPALKNARVAFIDAQRFDHMGLITSGRVLPWILRNTIP
jgi:hypothetical protein